MSNAQDAITGLQKQALDAIRTSQENVAEAVEAWSQAVGKLAPAPEWSVRDLPPALADTVGDPSAILNSVYDFAGELLALNKQFVNRLLLPFDAAPAKPSKVSAK